MHIFALIVNINRNAQKNKRQIEKKKEGGRQMDQGGVGVGGGSLGRGRLLVTHLSLSGRRSSAEHPASFCMMPHCSNVRAPSAVWASRVSVDCTQSHCCPVKNYLHTFSFTGENRLQAWKNNHQIWPSFHELSMCTGRCGKAVTFNQQA